MIENIKTYKFYIYIKIFIYYLINYLNVTKIL